MKLHEIEWKQGKKYEMSSANFKGIYTVVMDHSSLVEVERDVNITDIIPLEFVLVANFKEVPTPVTLQEAVDDCERTGKEYKGEQYHKHRISKDVDTGEVWMSNITGGSHVKISQMWIPID